MARVPPVSRIRMLPYCRRDRMAPGASRETRNHMTSVLPRIGAAVQSKLRTTVGKRFSRFVLVAIASLASSILMLNLLLGVGAEGQAAPAQGDPAVLAGLTGRVDRPGADQPLRQRLGAVDGAHPLAAGR